MAQLTITDLLYSGTFPDGTGNVEPILYTTYTPFELYPSSNMTNLFGPIYTPQVFAKDLDTLELASSHCISFAVNETRVLNMCRNDATSTTSLSASSNESLLIEIENGNASILLDETSKNVEVFAQNQIVFTACNGVTFTAVDDVAYTTDANLVFSSKSNIQLVASNDISIIALKDLFMSAKNGDVVFWLDPPKANIYFTASNSIYFNSMYGELKMTACESNVEISMSNECLYLFANSNVTITACNDIMMNIEDKQVFHAYSLSNGGQNFVDIESDYFSFGKRLANGSKVRFMFHINSLNELDLMKQDIDVMDNVVTSKMVAKYASHSVAKRL